MNLKTKLSVLNFLEFAVWGAYLTSMGTYLAGKGMASNIGWFYSVQGMVSMFMPALMGIVADRWVQAQRLLSFSHVMAGLFMIAACAYGQMAGDAVQFAPLFSLYTASVAFFMPTIALSYSVAYNALEKGGEDTVKAFPPIRVWGTVGFIVSMWIVDSGFGGLVCMLNDFLSLSWLSQLGINGCLYDPSGIDEIIMNFFWNIANTLNFPFTDELLCGGMQHSSFQFGWSGVLSLLLALYSLTMPKCETNKGETKSMVDALGLRAFALFKQYRMAMFFIFSFLLGVCLQITNGFANPFITAFGEIDAYKETYGVQHANILISLSQISETLCILLIPFFLKKLGIKRVMLIAMLAWVLRFAFFAMGNPGSGVWLFILSMIVYGVAFDFFNISGSLFVNKETDSNIRSSAQGLFMMMTNGMGAMFGTLTAQAIINANVFSLPENAVEERMAGWATCWYIFAAYALVVAVLFTILFRYKHVKE